MRFLKSDLARSLGLGFVLGSLLVAMIMGADLLSGHGLVVGSATAATHSDGAAGKP